MHLVLRRRTPILRATLPSDYTPGLTTLPSALPHAAVTLPQTPQVTSKVKKQAIGIFADAYGSACAAEGVERPPTLVVADLMGRMLDPAAGNEGAPSQLLLAALNGCFDALSTDKCVLNAEEEVRWLVAVNKQLGRGSEYRAALAAKQCHDGTPLTRADFISVYQHELAAGKFWGVEHDLRVLRGVGVADATTFTATFDYIYYTTGSLRLACVQDPLPQARMNDLLEGRTILPNLWHPSDHLPQAAVFEFTSE